MKKRCDWCGSDPLYLKYHDKEWGVPAHDDKFLFELLSLECAQAGLSWMTVLKKRENYREAFHGFDFEKIASYTKRDVNRLLKNEGIIRNRLKIESTINNAQRAIEAIEEFGSLDALLWQFVDGKPIQNKWKNMKQIPATTKVSDVMSKALKKKGFKFVGPTICYAFMQSVGMVNDHMITCFRYKEVAKLG